MDNVQPTLEQKIASIRRNLKYTEKRGRNEFHRYDYVMAADIAADMGKQCAEAGIVVCRRNLHVEWVEVENAKKEKETECRLTCTYVLRDSDTGAEIHFDSAGAGRDKGDKGVYKAHTGAYKYFWIQAFAMPIGDDPENDSNERGNSRSQPEPEATSPMTDEQCQEIVRLIGMANVEVKKVLDGYKVDAIKNLPYEKVKKALGAKLRKVSKGTLNEVASYPAVPEEAPAN